MRHLLLTALLVTGLSSTAFAESFAVADSEVAVKSTNLYKNAAQQFESQTKPEQTKLESLRKDLEALNQRYQRDEKVMSNDERTKLRNQVQSKLNEYNSIAEGLQKRLEDSNTALLKDLGPKLQKVIDTISKEKGYKAIMEKKGLIWSDPSIDITKQITERLNQQ